jgi:hypothetical protein
MVCLTRRIAGAVALLVLLTTAVACGDDDDGGLLPSPTTADVGDAGTPPEADDAGAERSMERLIFDLVNDERRARGLDPLEWDDRLAELARGWNEEMADRGRLEHQEPEPMLERAEGFTGVGENIFRATAAVPASTIHVGWMRSDGHRANVLRADFDRLGVGLLCSDDGQVWATQRFGSTTDPLTREVDDEIPSAEPIVAVEGEGPSCPGELGDVEIELR